MELTGNQFLKVRADATGVVEFHLVEQRRLMGYDAYIRITNTEFISREYLRFIFDDLELGLNALKFEHPYNTPEYIKDAEVAISAMIVLPMLKFFDAEQVRLFNESGGVAEILENILSKERELRVLCNVTPMTFGMEIE